MNTHIRWMIRRDMPRVLMIEELCFEFAWTETDFMRVLRQRNCIGMVATQDDEVVGFMIYELHNGRLHLHNLAVLPSMQQTGVGRELIDKLVGKLIPDRRDRITMEVRESNLDAQLFFKALGFRATDVIPDFYEDTDEDAYRLQYTCQQSALVN